MNKQACIYGRIALGTAQFGLPYGVANRSGQVPLSEARKILHDARQAGIGTLDTAAAYGDAEMRLGQAGIRSWEVISKLPACPVAGTAIADWVRASAQASLERLHIPSLKGILLHRPQELLSAQGEALYRALVSLKSLGLARQIGVSIYDPAELAPLLSRFKLDLVQAPLNPIDRRLLRSGWLARLKDAAVEVHVRSAFLQGLLLMPKDGRPAKFGRWEALWSRWHGWLQDSGLTPLQACLGFALAQASVDRVVVGVDSAAQLAQILHAASVPAATIPEFLASHDPILVNPSRWDAL